MFTDFLCVNTGQTVGSHSRKKSKWRATTNRWSHRRGHAQRKSDRKLWNFKSRITNESHLNLEQRTESNQWTTDDWLPNNKKSSDVCSLDIWCKFLFDSDRLEWFRLLSGLDFHDSCVRLKCVLLLRQVQQQRFRQHCERCWSASTHYDQGIYDECRRTEIRRAVNIVRQRPFDNFPNTGFDSANHLSVVEYPDLPSILYTWLVSDFLWPIRPFHLRTFQILKRYFFLPSISIKNRKWCQTWTKKRHFSLRRAFPSLRTIRSPFIRSTSTLLYSIFSPNWSVTVKCTVHTWWIACGFSLVSCSFMLPSCSLFLFIENKVTFFSKGSRCILVFYDENKCGKRLSH